MFTSFKVKSMFISFGVFLTGSGKSFDSKKTKVEKEKKTNKFCEPIGA